MTRTSPDITMTEGKITQLKIQNRDKDRVSVFIDGEYAFSVSLLAAAALRRGQELSGAEMAALKQEGDVHLAYQRAVRYLGYRPRSVDETRRHLVDKGYDSDAVESVIRRLMQEGYLDDVAFANYWVENREQFRPRGRRALAYELRQKGIDGDVIDSVLERVEEDDLAWSAVAGKIERWADLEEYAFKQRVAGYLDRRGFPYGVSREVADRAWNDVNSEE